MAGRLKQYYKRFLKRTGIRKGLIGGVLILLLVDLIWVASAALSRFLFVQEAYPKPLFSTYFKTTLFSIYLTAFIFWRPWQRLCVRECTRKRKCEGVRVCTCGEGKVCVCGKSQHGESHSDPLLTSDSDTSDTSMDDHSPSDAPPTPITFTPSETTSDPHHPPEDQSHTLDCHAHPDPTPVSDSPDNSLPSDNCDRARGHSYPPSNNNEPDTDPPPCDRGDSSAPSSEEAHLCVPSLNVSTDPETGQSVNDATPPSLEVSPSPPIVRTPDSAQLSDYASPDVSDSSRSKSAACPFVEHIRDGRIVPVEGACAGGAKFVAFSSSGGRYGSFSGSARMATCPVNPDLKICLLGPPEYEPLGCYEDSSSEDEHKPNEPLSPCHYKCCKVRFKPTVEVREVKGEAATVRRRLFHSPRQKEKWRRSSELLSVWKVALLAAIFGVVWFFANYLYAKALDLTSVAAVNTLSSTSGVFVMSLAALPCLSVTAGDKLTLSRCLVTLISVGGAVLIGLSPGDEEGSKFSPGALFALGGSVLYAIYLVLLRRVVTDHDSLDIPMFFGFVGLFDGVLLLPLLVIWDVTDIEPFEFPPTSDVWTVLLVNGFVGTVLSELLWLWGVFLTSPLLGTLALSLVTPLSIAYSIIVGKAAFSWMFLLGAVLILLSFVTVTILDHYGAWDPLWESTKKLFLKARDYRYHREYRALSPESQSLITSANAGHCQDYFSPT